MSLLLLLMRSYVWLSRKVIPSWLSVVLWASRRRLYASRRSGGDGMKRVRLVHDTSMATLSIEDDDGIKTVTLDAHECEELGEGMFLIGRRLASYAEPLPEG